MPATRPDHRQNSSNVLVLLPAARLIRAERPDRPATFAPRKYRLARRPICSFTLGACLFLLLAAWPRPGYSQIVVATLGVGDAPVVAAVNPVTNQIYIANANDGTVSVIDGATKKVVATVTVGENPQALAVNPVTNKIYVANAGSNTVSVIEGATNSTTSVGVGSFPMALAVNPVNNVIYVVDHNANAVSVIDGGSNTVVAGVQAGTAPQAIAVNPVTNVVYVVNSGSSNMIVINGATNQAVATVPVGSDPVDVAVNPVTNMIYVANAGSNTVSVIDGNTNLPGLPLSVGAGPFAIAVNPVTNRIYAINSDSNNVSVIDGSANTVFGTVAAGTKPINLTINPSTNQIYVANLDSANLTIIDGNTDLPTALALPVDSTPFAIVVNPVTNTAYVTDESGGNVSLIDGATNLTGTVTVGISSQANGTALAVNPATGKIYVTNSFDNTVTVIDGVSNTTTTLTPGNTPNAVAVNPVTNQIYVMNQADSTVSVIDGASNTINTTVLVGISSQANGTALAVNPVTNQIYVTNSFSNTVTVIDGATNTTTTVTTGGTPNAVAVNPVTNKIYVMNQGDSSVSVIDGASNTVIATVPVGVSSQANGTSLAVNPLTNRIYVTNSFSNTLTVIDGASDTAILTLSVGNIPNAVAVNPVTNQIYVVNLGDHTVSVIDGASNMITAAVTVGSSTQQSGTSLAVNPATNKIYVTNSFSNTVTEIDGATNTATTVTNGSIPNAVAVNAATSQIYVVNLTNSTVKVISEEQVQPVPLTTAIGPLPGGISNTGTPTFTFTAASTFSPAAPFIQNVYFQLDTLEGPWIAAAPGDGNFMATVTSALGQGTHIVYAYATDAQDANSTGRAQQLVGQIATQVFTVILPATATILTADNNPAGLGQAVTFTTDVNSEASGTPTGTVAFSDGGTSLGTSPVVAGVATLSTSSLALGSHAITAAYSGDANFAASTSMVLTEVVSPDNPVPVATTLSPNFTSAGSGFFTLTVTGSSFVSGSVVQWNGSSLTTTFVSTTQLTAGVPANLIADAGSASVTVFNPTPAGGTSGSLTFAINNPTPIEMELTPTFVTAGGPQFTLTVDGGNFVTGSIVEWNGALRSTTFVSSAELTAIIPSTDIPTGGTTTVTVFNPTPGGGTSNALIFTINNPVPVLTSLAPSSVSVGGPQFTLTLNGSNFVGSSVVSWNGLGLTTTFISATQLTAIVPAANISTSGTVSVAVVNPTPAGGASNALTETIVPPTATTTVLTSSLNPASVGQMVTFTAIITPSPGSPTSRTAAKGCGQLVPSGTRAPHSVGCSFGTVDFWNSSDLLGTGLVNSSGVATFSTSSLAAGTYTVTAQYLGTAGFAGSTSTPLTEIITPLTTTTTTLTVSPNPGIDGQALTFTVTISPVPIGSPAGTVDFTNGSTLMGMATLTSQGTATFTTSTLVAGTYNITAVYSGNAGSAGSASSPLNLTVDTGYAVTVPQTPVTIAEGGSASVTISVPPLGGPYNNVVTMSASGLPAGATATFNPPTVTPGTLGATTVLTIQLKAASAMAITASIPPAPHRPFPLAPFGSILGVCGVLCAGVKRSRLLTLVLATLVLATAIVAITSCGGGGGQSTPKGNDVITVTGSNGSQHVSTTFTLTVQ